MKRNELLSLSCCLLLPLCCACGGGDDGGGDDGGTNTGTTGGTGDQSFAGQSYALHIGAGDWLDDIGGDVSDNVPDFWMTIGGSGSSYEVTLTTARDGAQDMCNKTQTVSASSNPYPGFDLGPTDFQLYLKHAVQPVAVQATAMDLTMTDVLPTGAAAAEANSLTATLDAREVYPLFVALTPEPTPDRLCDTILSENRGECKPCRDGQPYCLEMRAGYLEATPQAISITPVSTPDPACTELE